MRDPRGELGKHEGRAAADQLSDSVSVIRFLLHAAAFPIWIPLMLYRRQQRHRRMVGFSQSLAVRGAKDTREIAIRWALEHPDDYVLGEYDPKIRKAEKEFRKILRRRK